MVIDKQIKNRFFPDSDPYGVAKAEAKYKKKFNAEMVISEFKFECMGLIDGKRIRGKRYDFLIIIKS